MIIERGLTKSPFCLKMDIIKHIESLISSYIEENDLFIVEISLKPSSRGLRLLILVDGKPNVTIDQCAFISKMVGREIEEKGLIDTAYHLEVSSPGMDKPFKVKEQYIKNVGRVVQVIDNEGAEYKGELLSITDTGILLKKEVAKKGAEPIETKLSFDQINKTKLVISF